MNSGEHILGQQFLISDFDTVFSDRINATDWSRILMQRDLPDFIDAIAIYDKIFSVNFLGNLVLDTIMREAWRFQMLVFAMDFYERRDFDEVRSGLTASNLQRLCAEKKLASPGRVLSFLNVLQSAGYVRRVRSCSDKRIFYLEPTSDLIAAVAKWDSSVLCLLDAVAPADDFVAQTRIYPTFASEVRRINTKMRLQGWTPLAHFPEIQLFLEVDGGWALLKNCVAKGLKREGGLQTTTVDMKLETFGKSIGVSRSNLLRILELAYSAGLLLSPPRNGKQILLSPKLICAYVTWLSTYIERYRSGAVEALNILQNR